MNLLGIAIGMYQGLCAKVRLLGSFPFYAARKASITQSRGAGTSTITRATTATVMGYGPTAVLAEGQTLLTVASGELRFQGARRISEGVWSDVDAAGNPIPAATRDGSVVEAEATNVITHSNMDPTAWVVRGTAAISALNVIGPNGATSARTVSGIGTAGVNDTYFNGVAVGAAGSRCEPFIIIKKISTSGTLVAGNATDGTRGTWNINLATLGSGWELVNRNHPAVTVATEFTASATGTVGVQFYATAGAPLSFSAWVQVEAGTISTSFIPTSGSAVPRNKDVLDDQVSGNLTAAAGSASFQFTPLHAPSGTIALCGSYVDASNYTVILHDGTKYILRKRIAATNYDAELTAAFVSGTTYKIALKWDGNGSNLAVDGVLGTAHANADPAQLGTRWQWGADGNSLQQAGAAFKEMHLAPVSVTDGNLALITSP